MLKSKVKKLRSEITVLFPNNPALSMYKDHKKRKYTLNDWNIEDIRKVVFPEGREYFDPADEHLMTKWNETNWLSRDFLNLLTVEELKKLEVWLEERERKRG
ncbi:hypothetical protein V7182_23810 [Neobacillus drentensis]|uniref:hypothetical protein n=1 Tax=Neobacillus drentensis TaxID=220684 RepID=UPI002FFF4A09